MNKWTEAEETNQKHQPMNKTEQTNERPNEYIHERTNQTNVNPFTPKLKNYILPWPFKRNV